MYRISALEAEVLRCLAGRAGQVVTRALLEREVWGYSRAVRSEAVPVAMRRLRRKLERDPKQPCNLHTVRGVGWTLNVPMAGGIRHNLPAELDTLFGREQLLSDLDQSRRLVTLLGPPGVGKSRLARAAAHRSLGAGAVDEAWWVPIGGAKSPGDLQDCVARVLGVSRAQIEAALGGRGRVLLVLDGVERLLSAVQVCVGQWLGKAPTLRVWATSTERLSAPGEEVVRVGRLATEDAVSLLVDRARAAGGALEPTPELLDLVEALDGLPLALELAAARAHLMAPAELTERVREGPAGERVSEAFSWAVDRLDDRQCQVLGACSHFRAPFDVSAVEALSRDLTDIPGALAELADCSLLRVDPGAVRPLSLPSGLARWIRARGVDPELDLKHRAWVKRFGEATLRGLRSKDPWPHLVRIHCAIDELNAARREAVSRERVELSLVLDALLFIRGTEEMRREVLSDLPELPVDLREEVWVARSWLEFQAGDLAASEALAALPDPGPRALRYQAMMALRTGALDRADQCVSTALAVSPLPHHEAPGLLTSAAQIALRRGRADGARVYFRRALGSIERHGPALLEPGVRREFAEFCAWLGEHELAERELRRALVACRRDGESSVTAGVLTALGSVLAELRRPKEAESVLLRARDMLKRLGNPDRFRTIGVLTNLVHLYLDIGRYHDVEELGEEAMRLSLGDGNAQNRAVIAYNRAFAGRVSGRLSHARALLEEGLVDAAAGSRVQGYVLASLAAVSADLGREVDSQRHLSALETHPGCSDPVIPLLTALAKAHVFLARGKRDEAVAALHEVEPHAERHLDLRLGLTAIRRQLDRGDGASRA